MKKGYFLSIKELRGFGLLLKDAELGRLVRAMGSDVYELCCFNGKWYTDCDPANYDSPEEALRAAGVGVPTLKPTIDPRDFEEAVHQQAKSGMAPIPGDPRTHTDDGFPLRETLTKCLECYGQEDKSGCIVCKGQGWIVKAEACE